MGKVSLHILLIVTLAACGSQDVSSPSPAAPSATHTHTGVGAGITDAGVRGEGLSDITLPEPLFRACKDQEDIVEATQCMWHRYREVVNGKKQQRNRWRNANSAVQCNGGMSVERAERRVRMGTNASLWQRVAEAIRACNAPVPSVGFTPLKWEGGATSLRLMGGGGLTINNASGRVTGTHTAEVTEGEYISGLTSTVVVELPALETDPGTFRVTLDGLETLRKRLGLAVSDTSDMCQAAYSTCQMDRNCFCVTSQSGQTSTLGLTGPVYRATFDIEIFGSTKDDNIVAGDGLYQAGINVSNINGTRVSTAAATIDLTVNEDDIVVASLWVERTGGFGSNGHPNVRIKASVNRPVRGGFNLHGDGFVNSRGSGSSWEILEEGSGIFTTGPRSGNWEMDCSGNRNPRFDSVEFQSQLVNIIGDEHFVIRYPYGERVCPQL